MPEPHGPSRSDETLLPPSFASAPSGERTAGDDLANTAPPLSFDAEMNNDGLRDDWPRDGMASALPEQIADFRPLSILGEGGMGIVYLAEQLSPRRNVALKVVRPTVMTPSLMRRFEFEADILGRLAHPGVAQIYQAGIAQTPLGRQPYFAMEYVEGEKLDDYIKRTKPSHDDRLRLLLEICRAVHHAHTKGIIHRDLKPANIIVTATGKPKVLDFGVARATDSDVQGATMHTESGALVGTLPYMSPEQAAGRVTQLDTSSDVYALGVIAYEMVGGQMPYALGGIALHEAVRLICEHEPTRLSSIDIRLRGDVETVVQKALEKESARRYADAGQLAEDVRRILEYEPITARAPSTWYNARKFARRNKGLVAAVTTVIVVLSVGVVGTAYGLVIARGQRKIAQDRASELVIAVDRAQTSERATQAALAEATFRQARLAAQRGAWPEARDLYRQTAAAGYADQTACQLGELLALQNLAKALEAQALLKQIGDRPGASDDARVLFAQGRAIWNSDPIKAAALLRRADGMHLPVAQAEMVKALLASTHADCVKHLKASIEAEPFDQEVISLLSIMQLLIGDFPNAEESIIAWQAKFPRDPMARVAAAVCLESQERDEEARAALDRAADVLDARTMRFARNALSLCSRVSGKTDSGEAITSLITATRSLGGDSPLGNLAMPEMIRLTLTDVTQGALFFKFGNTKGAIPKFSKCIERFPTGAFFALRAEAYAADGQAALADRDYRAALSTPSVINIRPGVYLAAALNQTQMLLGNIEPLDHIDCQTELAKNFMRALDTGALTGDYNLGITVDILKKYDHLDDALLVARHWASENPSSALPLIAQARVLRAMGRAGDAYVLLSDSRAPTDPQARKSWDAELASATDAILNGLVRRGSRLVSVSEMSPDASTRPTTMPATMSAAP